MNRLDPGQPRKTSTLFLDALALYLGHLRVFLLISAAVVVPVAVAVSGFGLEELTAPYDPSPSTAKTTAPAAVSFLVVGPLITATCIYALQSASRGEPPAAGPSLMEGLEAFRPIFLAIMIAAIGIVVGFALLVLPGIYLAIRWYFVPQAVVLEGARAVGALGRSGDVVRGFWWRTLGVVLLANLAATVVGLVVIVPFLNLAASADREIWRLVGETAGLVLTTPFIALISILLFYDLRNRRSQSGRAEPLEDA